MNLDDPSKADAVGDYVVVARRYRPQAFAELVGQSMVSQALKNAINTDRVGHAYLFTGARGVGKTSTARIFAKALNCVNGPTPDPCGKCDVCLSVANGEDVDVLEIDGASNRGIDEIRQLRSNVGIRPSRSVFKVYIIDEVHMLTKEAFNALLKTLEEPPKHVKFIFCTTEPGKIPITVLSRCQRFDFAPVDVYEIAQRLELIVQAEGAEADPEALNMLARRAAGSMRDSQSLLEQLLSFVGNKITLEDVHSMFGTANTERVTSVIERLIQRDSAAVLIELQNTLKQGVDAGQFTEQLLVSFRDILACAVGCEPSIFLYHSPADAERLEKYASQWGVEALLASIQILDQAVTRMRQSVYSQILLEVALVRIAKLEDLEEVSSVISKLASGSTLEITGGSKKKSLTQAKHDSTQEKVPKTKTSLAVTDVPQPERKPVKKTAEPPEPTQNPDSIDAGPNQSAQSAHIEYTQENARKIWQAAIDELSDLTADFASHASRIAISAPNQLAVHFLSRYNSSRLYCERPERRQKMEKVISDLVGKSIKLEFYTIIEDEPHATPNRPTISNHQLKRELSSHPLVEFAAELFEAQITKIDPKK